MRTELEKIRSSVERAELNPELTKSTVRAVANRAFGKQVIGINAYQDVKRTLAFARQNLALDERDVLPLNSPGVPAKLLMRIGDERAKRAVRAAWERETLVSI